MTIADVVSYLERLAPPSLAKPGDNIGLHVGDPATEITKIATSVDVTRNTIEQAASLGAELLVAHHPLIQKPVESVTTSSETGGLILLAAQSGLAVYVMHTNFDAAPGGTNDVLAERLGLVDTRLLGVIAAEPYYKIVVFVPDEAVEKVRSAMVPAGGFIGNYSDCSFRAKGVGTFKPLEGANPYLGETGRLEQADEWRLEIPCPENALAQTIQAMLREHPYEEVAYDIYPLRNEPRKFGLGRVGRLAKPERLGEFQKRVEKAINPSARLSGNPRKMIETVATCAGGGSSLVADAAKEGADALVTGDVGHHALLTAQWHGLAVIDAGHFETEKPGVEALTEVLARKYSSQGIGVVYVDR